MSKYTLSDLFEGDYPVTQAFGADPAYYAQFGYLGHEGVDFGTPSGTWVTIPFASGQILRTGYSPYDYGNYIVIWDKVQKVVVWYCHLSSINCVAGQILPRGTRIGKTGASGVVRGAHLHVNFRETDANGNKLNGLNGYDGGLNILDPNLVSWGTPPLTDKQKIESLKIILLSTRTDTQKVIDSKKVLEI